MNGCLGDQRLVLTYYREGPATDRAHVGACLGCAARYQRLVRDLERIAHVLEEAPPVAVIRARPRVVWRRALAVAAALAAVVLVGGLEGRMWRESLSWVRPQPDASETEAFLKEVSAVLSVTGERPGPELAMDAPLLDPADGLEREATDEWPDGPRLDM